MTTAADVQEAGETHISGYSIEAWSLSLKPEGEGCHKQNGEMTIHRSAASKPLLGRVYGPASRRASQIVSSSAGSGS